MADAVAKFSAKFKGAMSMLLKFRLNSEEFVAASNIIVLGIGGYYGAALYLTLEECDRLEGYWRKCYNIKFNRAWCTPRATVYKGRSRIPEDEREILPEFGERIHLYAVMSAALLASICRSIGDSSDSDQRAACDSAIACAFSQIYFSV